MSTYPKVEIEEKTIPKSAARPGRQRTGFTGVTVHETANYRRSADARSHAVYFAGMGENSQVSAHYYVDDLRAVLTIPEAEVAWHAGDGQKAGGGNLTTISIEICENWGYLPPEYAGIQSDVKAESSATVVEKADAMARFGRAVDNAAQLTAEVLYRNGKQAARGFVFQHNHWSGKDCPHNIRKDIPVGWNTFLAKVQLRLDALCGGKEVTKPATLYHVQVGAFASRNNAESLQKELAAQGYNSIIV